MPWKLAKDLTYFKNLTTRAPDNKQNAVIMGRKTYESIPEKFRPLPNRLNIVLSRNQKIDQDNLKYVSSLEEALLLVSKRTDIDAIFVCGGAEIYKEAMQRKECKKLYVTRIEKDFKCDTFFPEIPDEFKVQTISDEFQQGDDKFKFEEYLKSD